MKNRKMRAGFTLIELMVVLVILGLLATFIGPKIMSAPDKARVTKAINDIKALESALNMYKLDNGNYPTTDQGLQALVEKPELDPVPNNWARGGYLSDTTVLKTHGVTTIFIEAQQKMKIENMKSSLLVQISKKAAKTIMPILKVTR